MRATFDRSQLELPGDHLERPHGDCYWVLPGLILAGEYPNSKAEVSSRRKLEAILTAGIRQFIDLTEASEPLESYGARVESMGAGHGFPVRHNRFPIRDVSIPSVGEMKAILEAIGLSVAANRPVYVHCWGGIGRTGTVVGCLLVDSGIDPEQAVALLARKWLVMEKRHRRPQSPETDEQFEFIRSWPSARASGC